MSRGSGRHQLHLDVEVLRQGQKKTLQVAVDLNRDGFRTDLVPGTTRNSGGRDLDLSAVNAWRAANGRLLRFRCSRTEVRCVPVLGASHSRPTTN